MYALFLCPEAAHHPNQTMKGGISCKMKSMKKVVSLAIKTSKLTAEVLQKGYESPACQRQRAANQKAPAWENHYAAAYEAGRKGFQH